MNKFLFEQMQRINTLTLVRKVIFGSGSANRLEDEVRATGAKKVLLVTDPGVVRSGVLEGVNESLRKRELLVRTFSDIEPEPDIKTARNATQMVRADKFDLVCGVGGGSAMDIAKAAAVMATNPGDPRQYIGVGLLKQPSLPKILMPTTAGTGSEMTPNLILGIHEEGIKAGIVSPHVLADIVIVDPMLTVTLPAAPTASSGLDALTHAIESYISLDANPITDLLSIQAIELIASNLQRAFLKGDDIHSRSAMSMAAMMAGISIANAGTCSGHAAAYGYAAKYRIPHGISVAVALPYILAFNLASSPDKGRDIATALGVGSADLSPAEARDEAVQTIVKLMRSVNCPTCLSELGIPESEIENIAQVMLKNTRLMVHNPRLISNPEALDLITKMWKGSIV
jgi:alcohol dehydrogenase class IV